MEIKLKLTNEEHKELIAFCNLNDLLISSVVKDSFTTGFNIERYGLLNMGGNREKQVEKEVILEKRVEIPVEVIKEVVKIEYVEVEKLVEVIKEVPVEKVVEKIVEIIKEIPVEKVVVKEVINEVPVDRIVYVTDQQELNEKIFQKDQEFENHRKNFSDKLKSLENNFQNEKRELLLKIEELESKPPEIIETVKEVFIEKEVNLVDKTKMDKIQETLMKLRQENIEKDKTIKELEKKIDSLIQSDLQKGAVFLKGSNLDDRLYK